MPQLNFNSLAAGGPQSVYEGFMQGQEIRNKLAQQEQARQLTDIQRQHATLQLQNATREQRASDEEAAAWKTGAGDPKVVLQQLQQRGLGKSAMALQGQLTKQQTDKLVQQKTIVDLVKHSANQVFANPGSALQILQSFGQRTGIDMSDDIAEVQRLGGDLEAVKRWAAGQAFEADKLWPKFQTIDQNDKKTVQGFDPVTGQPVGPGTVYSVGMSPAQVAQNKIAQGQLDVSRGQLKATQDRDANSNSSDVVASSQVDDNGNVTHYNKFGGVVGPVKMGAGKRSPDSNTKAEKKAVAQEVAGYNISRVINAATEIGNILKDDPSSLKPGAMEAAASSMGMSGTANLASNANRQMVRGAQRDIVDALLYLSTGAAFSKDQFEGQLSAYIPQWSDEKATVDNKQKRVLKLINDARTRVGPAWTPQMEQAVGLLNMNAARGVKGKVSGTPPPTPATSSGWGKVEIVKP